MLPTSTALFARCPDAVLIVDQRGHIQEANPAACQLLGYTEGEFRHLSSNDLFGLEWATRERAAFPDTGSWRGELDLARKDGAHVPVEVWAEVIPGPHGPLYTTFLRDVTERKKSEERLRQSEQRYRTAFENAAIGIDLVDRNGRFVQVNATLCALTGYTEEELLATSFQDITHPDDLDAAMDLFHRLIAGQMTSCDRETRYVRKDGRVVWTRLAAALVRDQGGAPRHVIQQVQDITARKEAEAELRRSEARYRTLVEQLPAVVYLLAGDEEATPLYYSPYIEQLSQETPEEARSSDCHWLMRVHPDDRERVAAEDARSVAGKRRFSADYRRVRKDGSYVWVHDECVPLLDDAGQILLWQGVILDITERKQAEDALAGGRELLTAVLEAVPDPVYVKDTTSRFVRLNAATAAHLGVGNAAVAIGKTDFDFFAQPLAQEYFDEEQVLLATRQAMVSKIERQTEADAERWALVTKVPLHDPHGTIVGLVGINRDITALHVAEDALRRSEARFRSLISKSSDIITILDADGTIRFESPAVVRFLGYQPDELLGRNAFDLVHPDDRAAVGAAFAHALADPVLVPTVEFRFRHADGSWTWLESTGTNLLADPDVSGFVVNSREVTERKRAQQNVHEALEAAQAANRATNQFLAMMSHELRTPMQAILGYAELLLADRRALTPDQHEDIQVIHRGAERVIGLVGEILDLARLEAGHLQLVITLVDVAEIIDQVRQDIAPQVTAKGLVLEIVLPRDLPLIQGDGGRLRQILLNLVGNAVKFTDEGHIHLRVSATDEVVTVTVSDTGIGIAPEALPHIFEEFRQADTGRTRRYSGAGLGLAIAKKLAEQHGGQLSVASQLGVGSTFTLSLPQYARDDGTDAPWTVSNQESRRTGDSAIRYVVETLK